MEQTNKKLKIISIGGTEGVTKNMTVYEYGNEIIVVDCGVGFPDSEMHGVDVLIPDFSYLRENKEKIRALFITHGHEDHFGAVPYFLEDFDVPIFSNKLVRGFIQSKLGDKKFRSVKDKAKINIIDPTTGETQIGSFRVAAIGVNHSVPSSMGFAIRTPEGIVMHLAEYRIDATPVIDKPIEIDKISSYGQEGVLCLMSDCLNITHKGDSKSEKELDGTFDELFKKAGERQIFVTTISTNLSRMHQVITAAMEVGRKVVPTGRSIQQHVRVARDLGILSFDDEVFVDLEHASEYVQSQLVYLIAGCYGQPGSALGRLSRGEHRQIDLDREAMVIFSADPNPPGTDIMVERVMDMLTLQDAEVIYSGIQDNLHISGHGARGDLEKIAKLVNPKYFIPIGGTITRMREYRNMIEDMGISKDRVFENLEGESVEFSNGKAKRGPTIDIDQILIGSDTDEISPIVIRDREQLSTEGVFVVVIPRDRNKQLVPKKIEIITRGFIYVKESRELIKQYKDKAVKSLNKNSAKSKDWGEIRRKVELEMERHIFKKTRKRPMVIVHSIDL